MLPTLEEILERGMIPEFELAVVKAYPDMAQQAALEAAWANGQPSYGRGDLCGVLWRTSTIAGLVPVGGQGEAMRGTLPVLGPTDAEFSQRIDEAREQRDRMATMYVDRWNSELLTFFDYRAKMCQFATLWRNFTDGQRYPPCGQLKKALSDYDQNLPYLIRTSVPSSGWSESQCKQHLDDDFTFVGVAYWNQLANFAPRIFYNPMPASAVTFAQVRVFIPHRRLVWIHIVTSDEQFGGVPGNMPPLPPPGDGDTPPTPPTVTSSYAVGREPGVQEDWNLLNQHWTVQLVPATHNAIPTILQQPPNVPGFNSQAFRLPDLSQMSVDQIGTLNTH